MTFSRLAILGGLCCLVLTATAPGAEQAWGNIKGQVVWGPAAMPVRPELKVDKDQKDCLKNGPLLEETYLVDKATRGVKYVTVWLIPGDATKASDYKKPLPTHPSLKELKDSEKKVVLDQPCCMFEPSVIALR